MLKAILPLGLLVATLSGCNDTVSDAISDAVKDSDIVKDLDKFDGSYDLSVTSTTSTGQDGGLCGSASGVIKIKNLIISGDITNTWGSIYDVDAAIEPSGDLFGTFTVSGDNRATVEGSIKDNKGNGSWEDSNQCEGKWTITER